MTAPARASLMCSTVTTSSSWPSISNIVPLRKSLVEINQELHSQEIAGESKTRDHATGGASGDTLRPEFLTRVNVGDVDLDGRQCEGLETVEQRQRGMRQGARIDHDSERARPLLLKEVDELAFVVALERAHLHSQASGLGSNHLQ